MSEHMLSCHERLGLIQVLKCCPDFDASRLNYAYAHCAYRPIAGYATDVDACFMLLPSLLVHPVLYYGTCWIGSTIFCHPLKRFNFSPLPPRDFGEYQAQQKQRST